MNFLAHAFLADPDPALMVGGVVGDWIKGPLPGILPGHLARGVALHRAIDRHAESTAGFRMSRTRLSPSRRRWSGVLVDIYYDHLLARDWASHHGQPLSVFTETVYRAIEREMANVPEGARQALSLMIKEDWLGGYATLAGIADVLQRMASRARKPNALAYGESELVQSIDAFQRDFAQWLSDARAFADAWISGGQCAVAESNPD
jgi:acyl carrier protein phosphodiesterase